MRARVAECLEPILRGDGGPKSVGADGVGGRESADGTRSALATKIARRHASARTGLVERETETRLLLLAACCGEHLLLLGPPGTAKSELGRRLSALCEGGSFFERLLTRFGAGGVVRPLSMKGLEKDEYVRKIDGYLPTANVAFVDEIFKANSAILNSLLTILNERLFDNGSERVASRCRCCVWSARRTNYRRAKSWTRCTIDSCCDRA